MSSDLGRVLLSLRCLREGKKAVAAPQRALTRDLNLAILGILSLRWNEGLYLRCDVLFFTSQCMCHQHMLQQKGTEVPDIGGGREIELGTSVTGNVSISRNGC